MAGSDVSMFPATPVVTQDSFMVAHTEFPSGIKLDIRSADTADETTLSSYATTNQDSDHRIGDSTTSATEGGGAQTFENTTPANLTRCQWYIKRVGNPTGSVRATLYDGSYGAIAIGALWSSGATFPTGTTLATSRTTLDASDVSTSYTLYDFEFDGSFKLVAARYAIGLVISDDFSGDGSNYLAIGYDSTGSVTGNRAQSNVAGDWSANSGTDMVHFVYGMTTAAMYSEEEGQQDDCFTQQSLGTTNSAWGIAFTTAADAGILTAMRFGIERFGGKRASTLQAHLYALTGTYGTTATPTGSPLASSEVRRHRDILPNPGWVDFIFTDGYQLADSTQYFAVLEITNPTATNNILWWEDQSPSTYTGNEAYWDGMSWTAVAGDLLIYRIYSTGRIAWEYRRASDWAALTITNDETLHLSKYGEGRIQWSTPGDAATATFDSKGPYYWIRGRWTNGGMPNVPVTRDVQVDTTRYQIFEETNVFASDGLSVKADWLVDTIGQF